ncbi:MAG: exosortase H [bacterium]
MGRFLGSFCVILALLFVAELTAPAQTHFVQPWTQQLAAISGAVASWIDPRTLTRGAAILNPATGIGIEVVAGCNGVEAMLILIAAIVAFPAPALHKLIGVTGGVVAIQALNLVRVVSLYFLGQWSMAAFEFAHLYLWQALILLDVLIVWLVWLRTLPHGATADA